MPQAIPGEWFIAVVCDQCLNRIILYNDLSEGKSELQGNRLEATCPTCGAEGYFRERDHG